MMLNYHLMQQIYQKHHHQRHQPIRYLSHLYHHLHLQWKLSSKKPNYPHYLLDLPRLYQRIHL